MLAFYFDDNRSYHEGRGETTYDLNQGSAKPGWYTDGTYAEVTRVHFDQSFANARPKSTYYWFADMANLDNITNSTYINTSEVKNMESMFQGCRKMTSLDLSHFYTSKVTTMAHMFDGCIQATVLNVSNFDTSNVTDMEGMFSYCNSLTSLDVSHFNTAKVTNMSKMFDTCCDLTSLDVSNFDTSNVTDMSWMFRACLILESLDLSSFNTEKVTNMESMFNLCDQLRTIYIADTNDKWSTDAVTKSDFMFASCKNLVGGKGTAYASNHVDKTYARIDQSTLSPGYFTVLGT
jgi:surface protein